MAKLFKIRFCPSDDGLDSTPAITNANTAFVHTYLGDDFSGDGTREYPYKSAFKANQKSGVTIIVFRGVINESVFTNKTIIGDDKNQNLVASNYGMGHRDLSNLTIDGTWYALDNIYLRNVIIGTLAGLSTQCPIPEYCFITTIGVSLTSEYGAVGINNNTVVNYKGFNNGYSNRIPILTNFIVYKSFDMSTIVSYQEKRSYFVFSSACVFKYNSTPITQPVWTNDSKGNVQLLRNAYLSAGMPQEVVDGLFLKDTFGNETCRVVREARNGGTSGNIFNRYDVAGNVLDYTLNTNSNNEVLYASNLGGYVGCFKPASALLNSTWNTPIDVLSDGSDTSNAGTLLRLNSDQSIDFNTTSSQVWNRAKSNTVLVVPNGVKFNGIGAMSVDGSAFGYYFGKHQNLMNGIALTTTDALEVNSIYKVCNVTRDIYSAVIFNGTQYLPDYFFKTGTSVLNFTLLNPGSGTIVKKVLATPFESIEVTPYDDLITPSITFPRFSCPLSGNVLMLFHKIGGNIDKPVLFSEVTNDKIAYYAGWAVTNADQEFVTLAADTVNYYYKIPVLKYLLPSLNAHFNADYDQ